MGEDKKTLTIFSTLAKNSVKFFSQNRFTRAFSLLFANILDLCSNCRDTPCVNAIMQIIVLPCHRDLLQEIWGLYIKKFRFFFKL